MRIILNILIVPFICIVLLITYLIYKPKIKRKSNILGIVVLRGQTISIEGTYGKYDGISCNDLQVGKKLVISTGFVSDYIINIDNDTFLTKGDVFRISLKI